MTQVYTSGVTGVTAFTIALGPVQYRDVQWAEGLNLSSSARGLGSFATPRVLYGISCNVQVASGATSVAHFWSTANGTAPASGTALDTGTAVDLNAAGNTRQDVTLLNTVIATGYGGWMTATGAGTSGSGVCTWRFR